MMTHGLPTWGIVLWLWRTFRCKYGIHMFDEVMTYYTAAEKAAGDHDHSLVCDACQLTINILNVDRTYQRL